ncbi:MAG: DNA-processing protein DprA [Muribaculaceae bacterium]|nr:DNA-processing protein DprA [Muribaculaceae bacterium]
MADSELTFKVALGMLKGSSPDLAMRIEEKGITVAEFFSLPTPELSSMLGLSKGVRFEKVERDEALFNARKEIEIMERHHIKARFLLDSDYPVRLMQSGIGPVVLYQLGECHLESPHVINIVGTRKPTAYGLSFVKRFIEELAAYFPDLIVVSGLAYGIDAAAHTAALECGVKTVAVVAHGLNMIYPAQHRDLARAIISGGGSIVTEYCFGSTPYRQRFLERNRIIAALSDVTVVAESDIRGGAMSTANTAFSISRDVAALPGRISDRLSSGCNLLIRKQKASLLTCAADIIELTGWRPMDLNVDARQRNLFPELDGDNRKIYDAIRYSSEPMQADRIHHLTLIPMPQLTVLLGELEFDGIIIRHPGNRFSLA